MKTAISLNDSLMDKADQTAKEMGISRSRLFSLALQDFLRHRRMSEITEQLNRVYSGNMPNEKERKILKQMKTKFHKTIRERW